MTYLCKQVIVDLLYMYGPKTIGEIRRGCSVLASDYSVEQVNADMNDLMAEDKVTSHADTFDLR